MASLAGVILAVGAVHVGVVLGSVLGGVLREAALELVSIVPICPRSWYAAAQITVTETKSSSVPCRR